MPKTTYPAVFREKFIRGLDGYDGSFRDYCARFGVSHETGYDWLERFEQGGLDGLEPRSSAPHSCPHQTPTAIEELVIRLRREHPSWGPRKLKSNWERAHPGKDPLPAPSTIAEVLKRAGLVAPRKRRHHATPSVRPFKVAGAPNDVWTVDFKGQFRTGDGRLCYPLTLVDAFSRYILRCDGYLGPTEYVSRESMTSAFREYGLPLVIHSDNGTPFASTAPGGLSRLSAWWVRLGILPERNAPATPSDNGRHERMHRTLKAEATKPVRANLPAQQRALNRFRQEFNEERPHEALGQVPPAEFYSPSPRPYPRRLPELEYPSHMDLRLVSKTGHCKWHGVSVFISEVLAKEVIGLHQVADGIWEVHFGPVLLGTLSDARPDLGLIRPA